MSTIARALGEIALGLAIAVGGSAVWSILFGANFAGNPAQPWSIPAMTLALFLLWRYLSGAGWPSSTSDFRSMRLPRKALTATEATWGLAAALSGSLVFLCLLLAVYRLAPVPIAPLPDAVNAAPGLSLAYFAMASIVAGIVEEVGFRGYMQAGLQELIGWFPSSVLVAGLFALFHAAHAEFLHLIPVYIGASICYSLTVRMTGSLWPAIAAHAGVDFVSLVLLLIVGPKALTAAADLAQPDRSLQIVALLGILSFLVGIMAYWNLSARRPGTHG